MKDEISGDTPDSEKNWLDQLPIRIKKKFWNADKIISLSAFMVSIATLLALMYQIRLSSEQNRLAQQQQELILKEQYASVLPYLELRTGTNNGNRLFELILSNNGVGPAFIEEIRIVYDENVYVGDPSDFLRTMLNSQDDSSQFFSYGKQTVTKGQVIPAGEQIAMITAYDLSATVKDRELLTQWFGRTPTGSEKAKVEIVYSSVYGEQWLLQGIGRIPKSISNKEGYLEETKADH